MQSAKEHEERRSLLFSNESNQRRLMAQSNVERAQLEATLSATRREQEEAKRIEDELRSRGHKEDAARISAAKDAEIASLRRSELEKEKMKQTEFQEEKAREEWAAKAIESARKREEKAREEWAAKAIES